MALMLYSPQNDGGAEVNGIISFIIWCLWIYLLKKGYAIASSILSTIVSVGIKVYKFGVGDNIYDTRSNRNNISCDNHVLGFL